jgi:hypothetical protein
MQTLEKMFAADRAFFKSIAPGLGDS